MKERERTDLRDHLGELEKETRCLAELMSELQNRSKRLRSLMGFFYQYGFKKIGVTPEEATLRSIVKSFNKDWTNEHEEISVTVEDMRFLLKTIIQMMKIRHIINEISAAGYNVDTSGNKWRIAGSYFY